MARKSRKARNVQSPGAKQQAHHGATNQRTMSVADLRPHPRLMEVFPPNEADIERLRADIEVHGLDKPLEVLPDGTVIAGHTRLEAVRRLGWADVPVIIRHDLAEQGDAVVFEYGCRDNLQRRQLSMLGRARAAVALIENHADCPLEQIGRGDRENAKAFVAAAMGVELRTVNRWLFLLKLPAAILAEMEKGTLKPAKAGRIARLPADRQEEIADRVIEGEPIEAVVARLSQSHDSTPGEFPQLVLHHVFRNLANAISSLEARQSNLSPAILSPHHGLLVRGAALLGRLAAQAASAAPKPAPPSSRPRATYPDTVSRNGPAAAHVADHNPVRVATAVSEHRRLPRRRSNLVLDPVATEREVDDYFA